MTRKGLQIVFVLVVLSNVSFYRLVMLLGSSMQKHVGAPLVLWTPICTGLAAVALVLAVLLALRKLRLRTEAAEVITSFLLAESATAFFGLFLVFLGLPQETFLYFLGGTLLVQLVFVTPLVFGSQEK